MEVGGKTMDGHKFKPMQYDRQHCQVCKMTDWHTNHVATLPGMEGSDQQREEAWQLQQAEELTARLRSPGRDISARSGDMERNSPLFIGTGDNPVLF
jgi:hypothetical protein